MEKSKIIKPKTLEEQLLIRVKVGSVEFIDEREYRSRTVRKAVTKLNAKGYDFIATEKGVFGGINVIRNK